jgi:hypothetical protein
MSNDRGVARRRLALGVIASTTLMIILDKSVVTVAMPAIQADLGFSPAGLTDFARRLRAAGRPLR